MVRRYVYKVSLESHNIHSTSLLLVLVQSSAIDTLGGRAVTVGIFAKTYMKTTLSPKYLLVPL